MPVPVAVSPPQDCHVIPVSMPVGSPPSAISAGFTCPKPTADVPHAEATPSVGAVPAVPPCPAVVVDVEVDPTVEPGAEVDVCARAVVVVVVPFCADGDGGLEHADASTATPTTPTVPTNTRIGLTLSPDPAQLRPHRPVVRTPVRQDLAVHRL